MAYIGAQPTAGVMKSLDTITPDGSSSYTLQYDGAAFTPGVAERLIVSLDGVTQAPNVAYQVNGSTITFAAAIPATSTIDYIVALGEVGNTVTVADGAVSANKLGSDLVVGSLPVRVNSNTLNSNVTIAANQNALIAGPITIGSNTSITVNGVLTIV